MFDHSELKTEIQSLCSQYNAAGIASYVAQTVTGIQYSHLATELILLPLGMTHSFYDLNVYATHPLALPHVRFN